MIFPSLSSVKALALLFKWGVVFREVSAPCARTCVCAWSHMHAVFCPWIYKHVPSISSFHRQGLGGRQISSLPLRLPKLSSSLSNFPPQRPTRTHFTHLWGDRIIFFLSLPPVLLISTAHLPPASSFHLFIYHEQNHSAVVALHEAFSHFPEQQAWIWISFSPYQISSWCLELTWLLPACFCIFQLLHLKVWKYIAVFKK